MKLLSAGSLLLAAVYRASAVTPVEKVITLIEDLKTEVETEGVAEATTYDSFACFCKDTTSSKSQSITGGRDNIDLLSADIADKTAKKEEKDAELAKRKSDQEELATDLQTTETHFQKEQAVYEASEADLSKAISSLDNAIKAMEKSKPASASLMSIRESVERSLALADIMNLISEPKHKAVSAFLQTGTTVDPVDPTYKYHSHGIIETLDKLLTDFRAEKTQLGDDWAVAKKTFENTITDLSKKMDENKQAMDELKTDVETLTGDIAKNREELVDAEAVLKDDQLYLKDLTEQCEARAKDWDQRSSLRNDELTALAGALEILKGKVSVLDTEVNKRALLQRAAPAAEPSLKTVAPHNASAPSFLQEVIVIQGSGSDSGSGSGHAQLRGAQVTSLSLQQHQDKVVALLGQEGRRLGSATLASLAMRLADDPFTKVKTLIQKLIERLLAESASEATKNGFCNTELGKAEQDRDFRLADSKKLDQETRALEIKLQELDEEIDLLTSSLETIRDDLKTATELRATEKDENIKAIKQAKEGVEAVTEALNILKVFYKQSAKAKVLLQASPVDEDTTGAGFSAAYKGKQQASGGIIGMLETIASDFDRTARTTEASEKKAHEEFVNFDQVSKTDISGKDTKKTLDEEDVKTTKNSITQTMGDLQTAQDLLDAALERFEDLKPTCIDTAMSFEDRVAKREEEVEALKKALCILDTEGVEADCQGQGQGGLQLF
mmetsp:Transcript_26435/g.75672  ORF Transcript_26435/g.75672 Transcript_26435/m.75672 type:complete len:727 (-) Transcript_26435:62-2242(-)